MIRYFISAVLAFNVLPLLAEDMGKIEKLSQVNRSPFVPLEYLMLSKMESSGKIVASYRQAENLANNDKVYVDMGGTPVSVGDRFTVLKSLGPVKKPNEGAFSKGRGQRIQILGSLRVTNILPDMVEGILYDCTEDVMIGNHVVPLMTTQIEIKPTEPVSVVEGEVLAPAGINHMSASYEMVFLNRGSSHGLQVNDKLHIVRKGEGAKGKLRDKLPDEAVAELVVIHTSDKFSTAYVRSAVETFESGARFRSAKSQEVYLDGASGGTPQN